MLAEFNDAKFGDLKSAGLWLQLHGYSKLSRHQYRDCYQAWIGKERIAIGCKLFTVGEWKEFNDATISMMDDGALEWWIKWKDLVFMFHKNIFG